MVSVAIIGAGRVGLALGLAVVRSGGQVVVVANRSPGGLARASALLKKVPVVALGSPLPPADLVLICVRDEAINRIDVGRFAGTVAHTSGALPSSALARKQNIASIHPLLAIVDAERASAWVSGATFGIEGDAAGLTTAHAFVKTIGGIALVLTPAQKAAYHAAAVLASNAVVATVQAAEALGAARVAQGPALANGLALLARSAIDNVVADGSDKALTGPVLRGDVATVQAHLAALPVGPIRDLYRTASLQMLAIALTRGLDPAAGQVIETLLRA